MEDFQKRKLERLETFERTMRGVVDSIDAAKWMKEFMKQMNPSQKEGKTTNVMYMGDSDRNRILQGDALEVLGTIPSESINCCVTSPPYWGLRDYGVEGQLGLEKTPEEYVNNMRLIFEQVKRVLKPEGTLWLNLGDSYATGNGGDSTYSKKQKSNQGSLSVRRSQLKSLKPKDLVGIPWRVAFALQADGWYLRQDIIWHKPNPMPESVRDRCTKAHEYIFLLSKSPKYHFNHEAIKEPMSSKPQTRNRNKKGYGVALGDGRDRFSPGNRTYGLDGKRNKRSVWTVTTKPFKGAHFATFPPDLIEPCILAGCPEGGIVLDPFLGSGTVATVAMKNKRDWLGIELNTEYVEIAKARLKYTQEKTNKSKRRK